MKDLFLLKLHQQFLKNLSQTSTQVLPKMNY